MLSKRGIERVAGILFPVIAVLVLLSIFIPVEIETPVDEFQASLQDIADHQERNLVGLSFGLVANLLTIASAAMLYLTFRLHHRPLALLAAFWFLAAAAIFMVSDSAKLALDSLAQQFAAASGPDSGTVETVARAMALLGEFTEHLGATFIALGVLTFGFLIVLTGAVCRVLGWLGIPSGTLMLLNWLFLVSDPAFIVAIVGVIGSLLFLLLTGIWLLVRGTSEVPATGQ